MNLNTPHRGNLIMAYLFKHVPGTLNTEQMSHGQDHHTQTEHCAHLTDCVLTTKSQAAAAAAAAAEGQQQGN